MALAFLMLLVVPVAFYRYGYRGGLQQAAVVVFIFALTASFGHRWMKLVLFIDSPTSPDARILIGFVVTAVFLSIGLAEAFLGSLTGAILGGLQVSVLAGLVGSGIRRPEAGAWKRTCLPKVMITIVTVLLSISFWPVLHWWSLLIVPGILAGAGLAELVGRLVRHWVLALKEVWEIALRMGPPIGGFVLGYFVIAFIFAGLFSSLWRADPIAFKGLSHPTLIDFVYYSVMTITTTGYGDVVPQSAPAKLMASMEALIGLAWTVVIFAAVMIVVQRRLQR
jgi:hypothetical protein